MSAVLANPKTGWTRVVVSRWYNARQRELLTATGIAVWYHASIPPVPIRWVLVRDPLGKHEPQAFLSTDLTATPAAILSCFVSSWRVETTFQEVRAHLVLETQRQWSDLAIQRTAPILLGQFYWANSTGPILLGQFYWANSTGTVLADHPVGRQSDTESACHARPERSGLVR